jgi:ComF family protein
MKAPAGMARAARLAAEALGDVLMPDICAACGAARPGRDGLCDACHLKLVPLVGLPYCPRCGATVGPSVPVREEGCYECPQPLFRFARVVRLGPYTEPLKGLLRGLKYRGSLRMRRALGRMLARAVESRSQQPLDVAVPVPMHWRRQLARGGNHAEVLARAVAAGLELPWSVELTRVRNTPPQVHLSRTKRIENLKGAFRPSSIDGALKGARVLLVDDVTTTGATANEAARTLLRAGAQRVVLAVVAKSERVTNYAAHFRDQEAREEQQ